MLYNLFNLLSRLLVGSGQIPLNIELQQDDHTVCCSQTVVQTESDIKVLYVNENSKIFSNYIIGSTVRVMLRGKLQMG